MKNILTLSAIAVLALTASNTQATELVKAQPTNTIEFVKIAKMNLAQSIKLNTVAISPIEKAVSTQIAMVQSNAKKTNDVSDKAASLAE